MAPRSGRTCVRNRMSDLQMETFITYMEQHTLFARGQITKLGSQGQKWTRMRLSAKSQKAQFNRAWNKTGHDEQSIVLSSNNERISEIFGKYGTGINIGRELGFSKCMWVRKTSQEAPQCPHTSDDELDWLQEFPSVCFQVPPMFQLIRKHMQHSMKIFDKNWRLSIFLAKKRKKGKGKQSIQKPTLAQMQALVDVVGRHLEIALDQPGDDINYATWEVVALFANKADKDGVHKNGKSWRKTWTDLIISARQNMYMLAHDMRQNPVPDHHVNAMEIVARAKQMKASSLRQTPQQHNVVSQRPSLAALKRPRVEGSAADFGFGGEPSTSSGYRGAVSYGDRHFPLQQSSPWTTWMTDSTRTTTTATATSGTTTCSASKAGSSAASSSAASSSTATAAAEKSSAFLKAFDSKIKELVDSLAAQLISCFEQQNLLLQNCFAKQNELLQLRIQDNDLVNGSAHEDDEDALLPDNPTNPSSPIRNDPVVEEEPEETEYTIQEKCPICLDDITRAAIIPRCAHVFCYQCIYEWVDKELECPLCRIIINTFDIAELP